VERFLDEDLAPREVEEEGESTVEEDIPSPSPHSNPAPGSLSVF